MPQPHPPGSLIGNLFNNLPAAPMAAEEFVTLLQSPALKIERIVSTGQCSPPEFWYDQEMSEWVLLLQGEALLDFEGEPEPYRLIAGDFLHIPAHQRHRVSWTPPEQTTIWLAIHHPPDHSPCPSS